MQLKDKKSSKLAAAACSLLGVAVSSNLHAEEAGWNFDALMAGYAESDDRIKVLSFKMDGVSEEEDGSATSFLIGVDSITGNSPSGAVGYAGLAKPIAAPELSKQSVDTLAKASGAAPSPPPPANPAPTPPPSSGGGGNTKPAPKPSPSTPKPAPKPTQPVIRSAPLFGEVADRRFSAALNWTTPVGRLTKLHYGLSGSTENDYQDLGLNSSISRDFNQKNTTVSAGIAYAHDEVDGSGGNHTPFSSIFASGNEIGKQVKDVTDLLFGVTQVFSKRAIGQFNYTLSNASGYMNDPYKVVSIVNASGQPIDHIYENRPDSRLAHALYGEIKLKTDSGVLKPSYRFFSNDWGITSHSFGLSYRRDFGKQFYIEPRARYYTQTAADFYHAQLSSSNPTPEFASSDYRLAAFDAVTVGLKLGGKSQRGNDWALGLDYYTHIASDTGNTPAGQIRVDPDLQAIALRLDWSF